MTASLEWTPLPFWSLPTVHDGYPYRCFGTKDGHPPVGEIRCRLTEYNGDGTDGGLYVWTWGLRYE